MEVFRRNHLNENQAIRDCQEGRIRGLRVLYDRYKDRVFRTCLRILGDRHAAEDTTQEIFLRVFSKASSFNGRSAFSTWLYRLAVNHSLNALQKERTWGKLCLQDGSILDDYAAPTPSPDQVLVETDRLDMLTGLLAALSAEYRAVIVLREIEGLCYREIAEVLEIPEGTVMSRLSRARLELKKVWIKRASQPGIKVDGTPVKMTRRKVQPE